jgi:hypothetical protein
VGQPATSCTLLNITEGQADVEAFETDQQNANTTVHYWNSTAQFHNRVPRTPRQAACEVCLTHALRDKAYVRQCTQIRSDLKYIHKLTLLSQ